MKSYREELLERFKSRGFERSRSCFNRRLHEKWESLEKSAKRQKNTTRVTYFTHDMQRYRSLTFS